ncbi:hypothetical protein DERF_011512 [Dermatophagoides farinae]|uniref:Uncharacterized protein n=1 Tax=Dermatophagoides farinae TaxID=6954 RepID=A0A922L1P9_DERFA|nr:hypothetical protein DERF_011512 [Dermatophagoides farinae]
MIKFLIPKKSRIKREKFYRLRFNRSINKWKESERVTAKSNLNLYLFVCVRIRDWKPYSHIFVNGKIEQLIFVSGS